MVHAALGTGGGGVRVEREEIDQVLAEAELDEGEFRVHVVHARAEEVGIEAPRGRLVPHVEHHVIQSERLKETIHSSPRSKRLEADQGQAGEQGDPVEDHRQPVEPGKRVGFRAFASGRDPG